MIMLTIIYWMSGLPPQLWRFGLFASIGLMTSLIAEGMGLAIGMTFSITVSKKVTFGTNVSKRGCSGKYLTLPPDDVTTVRDIYYRVVHSNGRLLP